MRWQDLRKSDNVEDRRSLSGRAMAVGGGGIGMLILIIIFALMGGDPAKLAQVVQQQGGQSSQTAGGQAGGSSQTANGKQFSAEEQQLADFVSRILGDTEDVWNKQFAAMGKKYEEPKLVLFTGQVQSSCGFASAASGPFYCPGDHKVYIDLSFYQELKNRFKAPGDFAQAYVIAHEVGHHVQNLLGISGKVDAMRSRVSKAEMNELSVRLELQADFLAGVWAHYAQKYRNVLEPGDIEEALRAASQIGDDNIQKQAQGYVVPESFTHGTGEQRVRWFRKGYETGDVSQGDTFGAKSL
jgi:predicted metalloprotease